MIVISKNVSKWLLLAILLAVFSFEVIAANVGQITGKYKYSNYSFTLPGGEMKGFESLGAKDATLEIRADKTISLTMHMIDGSRRIEQARIVKLEIAGNKGYWLAKWPDVPGLVRKDFTIDRGVISYEITFSKENGQVLNGVHERGTLTKISDI